MCNERDPCEGVRVHDIDKCAGVPVPDLGRRQVFPDLDLCAGVPDPNLRQVFLTLTCVRCS
jgi:hypothetical protein